MVDSFLLFVHIDAPLNMRTVVQRVPAKRGVSAHMTDAVAAPKSLIERSFRIQAVDDRNRVLRTVKDREEAR